ncbi:MAG: hypothetical protein ACYC4F_01280 [Armatimonadota bacterium]
MAEPSRIPPQHADGNVNALKHGVYADRFLSDDEKSLFYGLVEQLHKDFTFNGSSDFLQVELVAFYQIKLARSLEAGDTQAAERFDRMIRAHLSDLKATKNSREGEGPKALETTPAEWAANLLERLRAEEAIQSDGSTDAGHD